MTKLVYLEIKRESLHDERNDESDDKNGKLQPILSFFLCLVSVINSLFYKQVQTGKRDRIGQEKYRVQPYEDDRLTCNFLTFFRLLRNEVQHDWRSYYESYGYGVADFPLFVCQVFAEYIL